MPLIDLKTDLKSLKYGKDTLGGGYSGQPYIQTSIPDSFNGLGPREDFILRGGINAATDSLTDIKRLGKMFIDTKSPNGLLFIAKQQLLSRTAVRTQTSGILNEGIYSPLNTLAQAGISAFGGHLNKQGINPFSQTGAYAYDNQSLYFNKVKPNPNDPGGSTKSNRLVKIYDEKQVVKIDAVDVLTYTGGPGAPLGVGNTNIRFADQRTGVNNNFYTNYLNSPTSWTPKQDITGPNGSNYNPLSSKGVTSTKIYDDTFGIFNIESFSRDESGSPLSSNDVYKSGTLEPYNPVAYNSQNWTPKQFNPDSTKYVKTFSPSGSQSNTGVSGKYFSLVGGEFIELYNDNGQLIGGYNYFNVYDPNTTPGNTWPKNSDLIHNNNTWTYNQQDIIESNVNPVGPQISHGSPTIQDFRAVLRSRLKDTQREAAVNSGATPYAPDYYDLNLDRRTNLGSPGQRQGNIYADYSAGVLVSDGSGVKSKYGITDIEGLGPARLGLDKINSLPIYRSQAVTSDSVKNDLVKFRIAIIDNDNPSFKTFLHFRAFLGGMSDSYNATWNGFNYLGRGEQFFTYGGFTRQISLSWTVAAQSKEELIPMYKKLNYLASTLTPDYSSNGYMRGNLAQLTVGGYVYELPGIITGLTYDIAEDTPWEIGIKATSGEDGTVKELPHIIRVTGFNFIPIHQFLPQTQNNFYGGNLNSNGVGFAEVYGDQRFISLANGIDKNTSNYNKFDSTTTKPQISVGLQASSPVNPDIALGNQNNLIFGNQGSSIF